MCVCVCVCVYNERVWIYYSIQKIILTKLFIFVIVSTKNELNTRIECVSNLQI